MSRTSWSSPGGGTSNSYPASWIYSVFVSSRGRRRIALDKIRADRGIVSDEAFRKKMEVQTAPLSLMMDIVRDL